MSLPLSMKLVSAGIRGVVLALLVGVTLRAAEPTVEVGVARVDITPELPIRLSGY